MPQAIPAIIMAAGAAVSAYGAVRAAGAQSAAAKYNQTIAEQNATASRQAAGVEEARLRRQNSRQLAQMRANYGANGGGDLSDFADVMSYNAMEAEHDALLVRHEGELRARGYGNEAELEGFRAKNAKQEQGVLTAAGTLRVVG